MKEAYAAPKELGGVLIRGVIRFLKDQKIQIPLTSHILIAQSAGSDSIALATLLAKYGRRVAGRELIQLVHINHGWRPEESKHDEKFIRALGKKLGVSVRILRADKQPIPAGASWEEEGRNLRRTLLMRAADQLGEDTLIFTAHHADDLAETSLWRLFTGTSDTHGGGILARHGNQVRPLLSVRKKTLQSFLKEESQSWREDETNHEGRFLRSRMRAELMPALEKLFPKAVTHLVSRALEFQQAPKNETSESSTSGFDTSIFSLVELKLRRPHWIALRSKVKDKNWTGEIHLPDGWKLIREKI